MSVRTRTGCAETGICNLVCTGVTRVPSCAAIQTIYKSRVKMMTRKKRVRRKAVRRAALVVLAVEVVAEEAMEGEDAKGGCVQ